MDAACLELACGLVSKTYISQGGQALAARHRQVKVLLSNRRLPEQGWDDASIQMFIQDCALMDSNNFMGNVGVGEREGRVASGLVTARHMRLAHGIGRSGDIAAEQPKAAGSSLLAKLTVCLTTHALKVAGLGDLGAVSVLPLATGMAMTCCLLAIKARRPAGARWVLWSRVDQKTCLKAIVAAGLEPVVVELQLRGDELHTDLAALEEHIRRLGVDTIAAVVTTTSCFAPRACDDVVGVAKLCAAHRLPHMINNAYGVQSAELCKLITSAWRKGRVDVVVQSTDKNFMVPVGGAVIMEGGPSPAPAKTTAAAAAGAPDPSGAGPGSSGAGAAAVSWRGLVDEVNKAYPGRASMTTHLDLLITLLHWGVAGWKRVLDERQALYTHLSSALARAAEAKGQRLLHTPNNPISLAVTLDIGPLGEALRGAPGGDTSSSSSMLGSMLWARCVSGTRVVAKGKQQSVAGLSFQGYGSSCDAYPHTYLTAAAALGGSVAEADEFCMRLGKCIDEVLHKHQGVAAGQT